MSNASSQELIDFFDRFVDAFSTFDGSVVAKRFHSPFIAVHADQTIQTLHSSSATANYFQTYLDDYAAQGCISCGYQDLELHQIKDACLLATVTWQLYDKAGTQLTSWRESYLIARQDSELTVLSTIDHTG